MQKHTVFLASISPEFGPEEETMFRICLVGTNNPAEVFPLPTVNEVPDHLKHLELDSFGIPEILTFVPQEHRQLSKSQLIFLHRLQDVTVSGLDQRDRLELYVKDLADCIINECKLDDGGATLYSRFSRLALRAGPTIYTVLSDREGRRRSGEIVYILQHSKLRFDSRYKQGDIQMVAAMIAACQENFARSKGNVGPKVIYGIKVVGEQFFFYSLVFREVYFQQIAESTLPTVDLLARKYPSTTGLRVSKREERRKLLCLLHTLRGCCLSNTQF